MFSLALKKRKNKKFAGLGVIGGVLLGGLLIFLSCVTTVGTGETGVVKTFGRIEGSAFESGFHVKAPWNQAQADLDVQKINADAAEGVKKLIEYYYTQTWDGKLPETYVGDDSVSSILIGK